MAHNAFIVCSCTSKLQTDSEVQGLQTIKPVIWSSENPQTPWSQKTGQSVLIIPLNLDLVQITGEYTPEGEGLYCLILILYTFVQ
jgi:hypothetical protein